MIKLPIKLDSIQQEANKSQMFKGKIGTTNCEIRTDLIPDADDDRELPNIFHYQNRLYRCCFSL